MYSFYCLTLLLVLTYVESSSAADSCFYCESHMHTGCVDPYDKVNGTFVNCRTFLDAETAPKVASRTFHRKKPFEKIYEPTRWKRSEGLGFRCAKTQVEYSDYSIETIRMCVPVQSSQAACPQLRQNIGTGFLMRSCHECNNDNCNSSSQIGISVLVASLMFCVHKIKYLTMY